MPEFERAAADPSPTPASWTARARGARSAGAASRPLAPCGPGIVAGGVGLSSGEFVLWPYIASQVGLILLWGALVGVVTQFFLNMEVERYTLATGETARDRLQSFLEALGPRVRDHGVFREPVAGWAISSATLASYLFGGNPTMIAIVSLLVIGFSLTFAPVIYVALERLIFVKVAAVMMLVILGLMFAVEAESWRALPGGCAASAGFQKGSALRCSSAPLRSPDRAAGRISVRATGFATKGSAWVSMCRGSSARSPG